MLKIYNEYQKYGVEKYYINCSKSYYNPHQNKITEIYKKYISKLIKQSDNILDIACGDGLITKLVNHYNSNYNTYGIDPYFENKFVTYKLSFESVAKGELNNFNTYYDISICSYAFHLIDDNWIYDFLTQLSLKTSKFIIITPSKKIKINHPLWNISDVIREDKITLIILDKKY